VGVPEHLHRLGPTPKPCPEPGLDSRLGGENLEGHALARRAIDGLVHDPHAAPADRPDQREAAEFTRQARALGPWAIAEPSRPGRVVRTARLSLQCDPHQALRAKSVRGVMRQCPPTALADRIIRHRTVSTALWFHPA